MVSNFGHDDINKPSFEFDLVLDQKKKVSYYLLETLAELFDKAFYSLKMAGAPLKNKSEFMASMVSFALSDLEKGENSKLLKKISNG